MLAKPHRTRRLQRLAAIALSAACLSLAAPTPVAAKDLRIMSAHLPPYSMNEEGSKPGFVAEVAREMARRVGQSDKLHYASWSRVYNSIQKRDDRLLAPIARTAAREDKLNWVVPVFPDRMVLITYGGSGEPVSLKEASEQGIIGVQQDSLMHELAEKKGIDNLDVSGDLNSIARKFAAGRVDFWLSLESLAIFSLKEEGYDPEKVEVVDVINEFDIYIGGSPNLTKADMRPWRDAFESMKADGTYDKIMAKYGF